MKYTLIGSIVSASNRSYIFVYIRERYEPVPRRSPAEFASLDR